jgi:integrase
VRDAERAPGEQALFWSHSFISYSGDESELGDGLDPIAARALLANISDDRLYTLYLCAIVLGLRRGELLGLAWDAVDLDESRLWVRQTLAWVDGLRRIQPPKRGAARRVIPLPDVVVAALRASRKRQDEERAEAGERWTETGFVFTTRHGEPLSPYTLTKYWHEVRVRPVCRHCASTTCGTPPSRCCSRSAFRRTWSGRSPGTAISRSR